MEVPKKAYDFNNLEKKVTFRFLKQEDQQISLDLRNEILQQLEEKDWFAYSDEKDYHKAISDGFGIGCFVDGALVGCIFCILKDAEYASVLGYRGEQEAECADYSDVYVHPNYRGYGLQMALEERMAVVCAQGGKQCLIGTVAPDNYYSLRNFLKAGYVEVERAELYGGLTRIVMKKDISSILRRELHE